MSQSITIKAAKNGYILSELTYNLEDDLVTEEHVYETLAEALRHASDYFEPGSRHDEKRVYVLELPGDKNEKFTDEMSRVIWGSYEEE
jgi:hypothetical protein